MANPKALVILAEGAEEMETVIVVNILRRGKVDVTLASIAQNDPVTCSRGVKIVADCTLEEALDGGKAKFDAVVLPGGLKGSENLAASKEVKKVLTAQEAEGRIVAAVCAAPALAFTAHGIAKGKNVTSYPSFRPKMEADYKYQEERVVVDGNVITSRGPGTCFEFALALVAKLVGQDVADQVKGGALINF